jgi:curved DNA-binding protein CbpA
MKDPYLILGLLERKANGTVDDAAVKTAYLDLLRRYPPEREPEHFQQIRKAYEQLATRQKRVQYGLLDLTLPDREDLAGVLLPQKPLSRPSLKQVQDLLGQP